MQKNKERQIFHLDVKLSLKARGLSGFAPPTLSDVVTYLKSLVDDGKAVYSRNNDNQIWYISDYREYGNKVVFLANFSDKEAPDPSFSDPLNKKRRDVPKRFGEGEDKSVHLVFDCYQIPGKPHFYPGLMEFCPGMPTPKISQLFNKVLKEYARSKPTVFERLHPDGSGKKVKTWPFFEIHGHICDSLKSEIDNGKVEGLEIYTEAKTAQPWDSNSYTEVNYESIFIKPRPTSFFGAVYSTLSNVMDEAAKKKYEKAKVKFKNEDDISRTVNLYTDTMSVVNDYRFVKKSVIDGFGSPLKASYDQIYDPIVKKMLVLI